jgi:hypothetical protein
VKRRSASPALRSNGKRPSPQASRNSAARSSTASPNLSSAKPLRTCRTILSRR